MENSPSTTSPHTRLVPLYMTLAFLGTLAIGAIGGFFARPYIIPDRVEVREVTVPVAASASDVNADTPASEAPANTETQANSAAAEPAEDSKSASEPTIMDFLLADARHVMGADDAPVVIVEFSDFR